MKIIPETSVTGTFTVKNFLSVLGREQGDQYFIRFNPSNKIVWLSGEVKVPDWQEVYFNVNPVKRPESGRGTENDVVAMNCVFADFDKKDGWTQSQIDTMDTPPSIVVFSGRGWHCYWLFNVPVKITNDNRAKMKSLQERWVEHLGSDSGSKDLAHILRVPESFNNKDGNHIQVTIQHFDETLTYSVDDIERFMRPKNSGMKAREGFQRRTYVPEGGDGDGVGRDEYIFKYAAYLVGTGTSKSKTMELALEEDEKVCDPPLGHELVEVKVESAYRTHIKNHPEDADIDDIETTDDGLYFQVHRGDEVFQNFPPVPYIVDGIIPEGTITVLAGNPGEYKTTIALNCMVSVSRGVPFLGRATKKTQTMFVNCEMSDDTFRERAKMVVNGVDGDDTNNWSWLTESVNLFSDKRHVKMMAAQIRKMGVGLVVFDALSDIMVGGDENTSKDITQLFTNLREIMNEAGCSIILIHHKGKNGDYRGSTDIKAKADNLLVLAAKDGYVTIKSEKLRNGEPVVLHTTAIFSKASVRLEVPQRQYVVAGLTEAEEIVYKMFADNPDKQFTLKDIQEGVNGIEPSTAKKAFYSLARDKELTRVVPRERQEKKYAYELIVDVMPKKERFGKHVDSAGDDL